MFLSAHYAPEAHNDFVWTLLASPWTWLVLYLLVLNLFTFFTFGVDKWKAKRKEKRPEIRRVPEKTLFLCAALGGSLGALLGMKAWHHKTLHNSFRYGIPAILILQIALFLGMNIYVRFLR